MTCRHCLNGICTQLCVLGGTHGRTTPDWTRAENTILRRCAKRRMTAVEIVGERLLAPYRTPDSILIQSRKMGLDVKRGDVMSLLPSSRCGRAGFKSHTLPLNRIAEAFAA